MGGARRAAKGRGGPRGAETSRAMATRETVVRTGQATGAAVVPSMKAGVSAVTTASGKLRGAGAGCILQQHGAEIEIPGEVAFFAQQDNPSVLCCAAIMGQVEVCDCIWQASTNRAGARQVVIKAKTSIRMVCLRNIRLPGVYPCWVSLSYIRRTTGSVGSFILKGSRDKWNQHLVPTLS